MVANELLHIMCAVRFLFYGARFRTPISFHSIQTTIYYNISLYYLIYVTSIFYANNIGHIKIALSLGAKKRSQQTLE